MSELAFPLVATCALVLFAIPLATLFSKLALLASRRLRRRSFALRGLDPQSPEAQALELRSDGSSMRYLLLVAPVSLPTVWLVSAAAHHAEAEEAALACLLGHVSEGVCAEPLMVAGAVALLLSATFWWRRRKADRAVLRSRRTSDAQAISRLSAACAELPRLARFRDHVDLVEGHEVRTVGLGRPRIEVGVEVVRTLDLEALTAALLHEAEHVTNRDPLRFVLLSACQSINPARFLLSNEITRWRAGREVICDEAAVHRGADPYGLAQALITVARRPQAHAVAAAHLGQGGGMNLLRARVNLLLGYVSSPPRCHCSASAVRVALFLLVVFAALPHYWGESAIVDLHQGAERAVLGN